MSYPIIIKKEIIDFLKAQNAVKIYTNLSDDITMSDKTEVWLKSNTFITIEIRVKSDIVTQISLYHAGDSEIEDFQFYEQGRVLLGKFYAKVRGIEEEPVSTFPVVSWKLYCEVFKTEDSYGKELIDAKNVLNVLKDLEKELRDRFHDMEEALNSMIDENLKLEIAFKSGAVLEDVNGKMYRFLGDKDAVGRYLLLDGFSRKMFLDYNTFKTWQKVDMIPALEETLKRFYVFFDSEFIHKILEPATAVLGWEPIDSATINHNCEPFQQWVKQKTRMSLKDGITGLQFRFEATETIEVSGFVDFSMASISFESKSTVFGRDNENWREELFHPFLYKVSTYSRGITQVLSLIYSIYETFSQEIAALNLTTSFLDIYSMWEQIQLAVEHVGKSVDEDLLHQLKTELGTKPSLQQTANKMRPMDSFDGFFERQKPKTKIKLEDNMLSALTKMSDGNPGAMEALASLIQHPELVKSADPSILLLGLDSLCLYGGELYDFLIYCCENSIKNFRLVSLNHSFGNLSEKIIHEFVGTCTPFFPNKDNDENLKSFKDWSAFKDCYPEEEDAPFDPNKERHTWKELCPTALQPTERTDSLPETAWTASQPAKRTNRFTDAITKMTKKKTPTWSSFAEDAFRLGFEVGWSKKSLNAPQEILLFHTDGLVLYVCESKDCVTRAVVYGEIPFSEKDSIGKVVGAGAVGGKFSFVKDARAGLKKLLNELGNAQLSAVWTVKHPGLFLLTPEEKEAFAVDGKVPMVETETLTKQKLSKCCNKMKQIIAKNVS